MNKATKAIILAVIVVILIGTRPSFAEGRSSEESERAERIKRIENKITESESKINEQLEMIRKFEWPATDAYNHLLNYLKAEGQKYRPFYGGAYLNDKKQLVILVKEGNMEASQVFAKEVNCDRLILVPCRYSYDELYQVYEQALKRWKQQELSALSYLSLREDGNRIEVALYPNNEESRTAFSVWAGDADLEMFSYVEGGKPTPNTYVHVGEHATPLRSIGYRGFRLNSLGNPVYGFTSCGHSIAQTVNVSGTKVGELYDNICGGSADISFYDAWGSPVLSNVMAYTDDEGNQEYDRLLSAVEYTDTLLNGTTIFKIGGSSYVTSGTVHNTDVSFSTISHVIETTAYSVVGDSGGVLFIYHANQYKILGSLHGGGTYSGVYYSFYSKYFNNKYALASIIYRY